MTLPAGAKKKKKAFHVDTFKDFLLLVIIISTTSIEYLYVPISV